MNTRQIYLLLLKKEFVSALLKRCNRIYIIDNQFVVTDGDFEDTLSKMVEGTTEYTDDFVLIKDELGTLKIKYTEMEIEGDTEYVLDIFIFKYEPVESVGMKIKVIERCNVDESDEDETEGLRVVIYNSPKNTLLEALKDYEENFDFDNVDETYDEFDGECLDSWVIEVSEVF